MEYFIIILLVIFNLYQLRERGRNKDAIFNWRRTSRLNAVNFESEKLRTKHLENKLEFANGRIQRLNDIMNGKEERKSITLADVYKMTGEAGNDN